MGNLVIENISFSYGNKKVFENLNIDIETGKINVFIGNNGVGKTTLSKIVNKRLKEQNIGKIALILEEVPFFFENTPIEYLVYSFNYQEKKIKEQCERLFFNSVWLYKPMYQLCSSEKQKLYFLSKLMSNPEIVILDEPFYLLKKEETENVIQYLSENKTTIILFTKNIEYSLYADAIYLMVGINRIKKTTLDLLYQEEKALKNMNFSLPFMIDLSKKLQYYNLINEIIMDMNEMVDILWK